MHEVSREQSAQLLWNQIDSFVAPFPAGVIAVPEPIQRTAFFPGGLGLWMENSDDSFQRETGRIMVVGQDFNTFEKYEGARKAGSEISSSATWRNLSPILLTAKIPPGSCFFTNIYMGLRDGGPETGRFPGSRNREFADRCAHFFTRQLEVCKPRLILTLGLEPLRFLCRFMMKIRAPRTLRDCVDIYTDIRLPSGATAVLVGLTHPCCYHANVWRRKYGKLTGREAETAMIREGFEIASTGRF